MQSRYRETWYAAASSIMNRNVHPVRGGMVFFPQLLFEICLILFSIYSKQDVNCTRQTTKEVRRVSRYIYDRSVRRCPVAGNP